MKNFNLTEHAARRFVDSLFATNAAQRGELCEWPLFGGHYVSGEDPIEATKELLVRALLARDWFARNGPPDAQPLASSIGDIGHVLPHSVATGERHVIC